MSQPDAGPSTIRVQTRDVDEAQALAADVYFPHRLRMLREPHRFGMRLEAARLGPLEIGLLTYDAETEIETGELGTAYEVNIPLGGARLYTHVGNEPVTADAGTAAVYSPMHATSLHGWHTGEPLFGLKIGRHALEAELSQLLGKQLRAPIEFAPRLDLGRGAGSQWWRLTRPLIELISEPAALLDHPLVIDALAHSVMTGLLYAAEHQYHAELEAPRSAAQPQPVRRAVELLEEHPDHHHTVASLAAASGASVRSLQAGFRHHLETTPMTYLRQVRLRRVRADLARADPGCTRVADIACRWGFSHLGRFAAGYRAAYGEAPSETLLGH
ncbi:MAG: helix-turn-helix domain-containing protein [Pseudonocardiaceae bacterium]|nr:helix-turn-helix domain-containing protein [Pseudonocardiaceae bacterium]